MFMQSVVKRNQTTNCPSRGCLYHFLILLSWLCELCERHLSLQTWCCRPHIWLGYTHASVSNVPIAHHLVRLTLICSSPSPRGRVHRLWDVEMETAGDTLFGKSSKTSPLPAAHSVKIIQMTTTNATALQLANTHTLKESQFDLLSTSENPTALCFSTDCITCCSPTRSLNKKNTTWSINQAIFYIFTLHFIFIYIQWEFKLNRSSSSCHPGFDIMTPRLKHWLFLLQFTKNVQWLWFLMYWLR